MTAVAHSSVGQRRHRRLIDSALQGRLIWQLVVFETILFAVAMAFVYLRLEAAIDAQLFRVHGGPLDGDGLPPILSAVFAALPWILLPNIVVIVFVARRWRDGVQDVVQPLDELFEAAAALDLRQRSLHSDAHEVLARAELWHVAHRSRCAALRQHGKHLSLLGKRDSSEALDVGRLRDRLQQIQRLTR